MVHAHVWRPLEQYGLTGEELAVMLKARMKLEAKGQNTAQDGPHNQIESKPAIDAVAVESSVTKE